jgi:hypothetical protein
VNVGEYWLLLVTFSLSCGTAPGRATVMGYPQFYNRHGVINFAVFCGVSRCFSVRPYPARQGISVGFGGFWCISEPAAGILKPEIRYIFGCKIQLLLTFAGLPGLS